MTFALYNAATAGTLVWGPETHAAVPVSNGLFSVGLGSRTSGGIPTTVWNGDSYLQVTVGRETLSPRELIRSVPIAGMALTMPDGAIGSEKLADINLLTGLDNGGVVQMGAVWMEADHIEITVQFAQAYTSTPSVFVTQNEASAGFANVIIFGVKANEFKIGKRSGTGCLVNWIAIGLKRPISYWMKATRRNIWIPNREIM